jgi:hypothetical protein
MWTHALVNAVLRGWLHEMQALHSFAMWSLHCTHWIESEANPIADAISRQQWERFHAEAASSHYQRRMHPWHGVSQHVLMKLRICFEAVHSKQVFCFSKS